MKFRLVHVLLIVCMGFLINCDSTDKITNSPAEGVTVEDFTFVKFDLASGNPAAFPLPNDVLRDPATGQLAFPGFGDPAVDALIAQINTLNGFSTSAFIRIPFDGDVDADTISNQTILVVDVTDLQAGLGLAALRPMTFNIAEDDNGNNVITDSDETGATVLKMMPITPLKPGHQHMVIVTRGVANAAGYSVESDGAMLALKGEGSLVGTAAEALEPLRQLYDAAVWPAAEEIVGSSRLFIPAAFVFTTETLHSDLQTMHAKAQQENPTADIFTAALGVDEVDGIYNLLGLGGVPHDAVGGLITGSINMPNYISDPVNGWIQSLDNPTRNDVPFLATLPAVPSPFGDGTYPTLIYQHGITSSKETMVALANSAASVGFATIAIDLVLHGERSIDADGDGNIDPSGATFINLTNVLLSRDNVRQSAADLMMVSRMISSGAGDLTGDGVADLNPNAITCVGMSLGGIVSTSFAAVDPNVSAAVLNVAGARVPFLLKDSPAFSGPILEGLASVGLVEGTSLFDIYFMFAQAIFDDADPFNYAGNTDGSISGGAPTAILLQEVLTDGVVPNSATRDLANALGAPQVDAIEPLATLAQVPSPAFGSGYYQFSTAADIFTAHGALLDPSGGNPTVALQVQVMNFLGSALLGTPTIVNPHGPLKVAIEPDIYRGLDMETDVSKLNFFPGR